MQRRRPDGAYLDGSGYRVQVVCELRARGADEEKTHERGERRATGFQDPGEPADRGSDREKGAQGEPPAAGEGERRDQRDREREEQRVLLREQTLAERRSEAEFEAKQFRERFSTSLRRPEADDDRRQPLRRQVARQAATSAAASIQFRLRDVEGQLGRGLRGS